MSKVRQSRMDAIQQGVDRIAGSNLLSDTLVSIALEDPPACQYVLRKILGQKDLKVVQSKGQYRLLNLTAKDSVLDVLAEDSKGRLMNVDYSDFCVIPINLLSQSLLRGFQQVYRNNISILALTALLYPAIPI